MIVNIAVLNVSFTTSCLTNRKFSPWTYTVLIKDALYLTTIIKLPYIPFFPLNFITVITILGNFEQLVIRDAYECIDSPKIRSFTDLFISILTTEIEYHVKVMCHYRFVSIQFLVFHGAKLLVFCCYIHFSFKCCCNVWILVLCWFWYDLPSLCIDPFGHCAFFWSLRLCLLNEWHTFKTPLWIKTIW